MLVLSRKLNESIVIDGDIRITVVGIRGNQIRLGIEAPERVRIFRQELCSESDNGPTAETREENTSLPARRPGSRQRPRPPIARHVLS